MTQSPLIRWGGDPTPKSAFGRVVAPHFHLLGAP